MSKKKTTTRPAVQESREFADQNQRVHERLTRMQNDLDEQRCRAEEQRKRAEERAVERAAWEERRRLEQERKIYAIIHLVLTVVLYSLIATSLCVLSYITGFPWAATGAIVIPGGLIAAFVSGCYWREFKPRRRVF
jgi:hypothetical protein